MSLICWRHQNNRCAGCLVVGEELIRVNHGSRVSLMNSTTRWPGDYSSRRFEYNWRTKDGDEGGGRTESGVMEDVG